MPRRHPLSLGFSRYSLEFAKIVGADRRVEVPIDPTLEIGVGDFSILFFGSVGVGPDTQYFVSKGSGGVGNGRYRISADGIGAVYGRIRDVAGAEPVSSIVVGIIEPRVYHFAFIVNRTTGFMTLYLNGAPGTIVNIAAVGNVTSVEDLHLGCYDGDISGLNGLMDEVLFYQGRALTPYEIGYNILNYHKPLRGNLVGWWRFEEGSGLAAQDLSSTGNNGVLLPAGDPPVWTEMMKHELRVAADV
ncbi:LamG domain-containing protein [Patescibacteria group bacterium]|nr:LamG domain-containing protein [Patescibacteria group bacterium]